MKTKVWINRGTFNEKLLRKEFDIVDKPDADYYICWSIVPKDILLSDDKLSRTIFIGYEPPLTDNVIECYKKVDKFHTAFMYNPESKSNQFKMTENPIYYPVNPYFEIDITRKDVTLKNRGVYYSGAKCKGMYNHVSDEYGINFKDDRDKLAEYFLKNTNSTIMGQGWPTQTKYPLTHHSWRVTKLDDINKADSDFHLCIENYLMVNLVSERLHDGFTSDRVILYLGDPEVDQWVPKNCYVDLSPYFNKETHKIDYEGIKKLLNEMSQEEYDKILNNARRFRKSMSRMGFDEGRDRITKKIIKRIGVNFVQSHFDVEDENKLVETIRPNFKSLDLEQDALRHIALLDIPENVNKICEIGSGCGRILKVLNKDRDVTGFDASHNMIKYSKKFFPGGDIRICSGNGDIPEENNIYDFVFSIITFQHIPNIYTVKKYISEAYRILKSGKFTFQILKEDGVSTLLKNYHSKKELISYMEEVGFKNIKERNEGVWIFISGEKND